MKKPFPVRPMPERVIVEVIEAQAVSKGGIVLPESAQRTPAEGIVVAVGPGKMEHGWESPMNLSVGDRVIFGEYAGQRIEVDGVIYKVLGEHEVFAVRT